MVKKPTSAIEVPTQSSVAHPKNQVGVCGNGLSQGCNVDELQRRNIKSWTRRRQPGGKLYATVEATAEGWWLKDFAGFCSSGFEDVISTSVHLSMLYVRVLSGYENEWDPTPVRSGLDAIYRETAITHVDPSLWGVGIDESTTRSSERLALSSIDVRPLGRLQLYMPPEAHDILDVFLFVEVGITPLHSLGAHRGILGRLAIDKAALLAAPSALIRCPFFRTSFSSR
ncbi:hypothetical protein B0H19DRAFT_1229621 [Mycena capillaripes]|nr:hypothetical protein B0H19DRAFT_1229621 [Mycena capillaripes]